MNDKFVKDSLLPDEKILATAKFHPIRNWIVSIIILLAATVLTIFSLSNPPDYTFPTHKYIQNWEELNIDYGNRYAFDGGTFFLFIVGTLALSIVIFLFIQWINSKDEFVITNKRVVAKVGVIRRVAFELHNEQMESIEISQGIVGRILNFGTLMPCGIGASKVRIPFVVNPFEFRQHFYDLKKPKNVD